MTCTTNYTFISDKDGREIARGLGGRLVVKIVFPDNSEKELKFDEQVEVEEAI